MKKAKKIVAVLIAVCMLSLTFLTPVSAVTAYSETGYSATEKIGHTFYRVVDKLITMLHAGL